MAADEARKGWGKGKYGDTEKTKVYAGYLGSKMPAAVLRAHFEKFGEILETVVTTDRETLLSRGYGFVTFKNAEAAERACEVRNPTIDGRRIRCRLAKNRNDPNRQGESSSSQPQHCPGIGGPASSGAPTSSQIGGQVVNSPQHEYTTCPRCGWNGRDFAISQPHYLHSGPPFYEYVYVPGHMSTGYPGAPGEPGPYTGYFSIVQSLQPPTYWAPMFDGILAWFGRY